MAVKFRFRLDAVRKLRQMEQDVRRRAVAEAVQALARVEARIARLSQELKQTLAQRRDAQQAPRLDLTCLRGHQFYQGWLQRRILESDVEMGERRKSLQEERARLADASKRLKVIEKLRERQWNRHQEELRREDQAEQDEVAAQTSLRRPPDGLIHVGAATGLLVGVTPRRGEVPC